MTVGRARPYRYVDYFILRATYAIKLKNVAGAVVPVAGPYHLEAPIADRRDVDDLNVGWLGYAFDGKIGSGDLRR